jgi:hypothetical protein
VLLSGFSWWIISRLIDFWERIVVLGKVAKKEKYE